MKKRIAAVAGLALATSVTGGVAVAGGGEDPEPGSQNYTAEQADAATQAALSATDGGTANAVERDPENGATWEVEVTRPDGTAVDVRLDDAYDVVVIEDDTEDSDETGQ